MPKKKSKKTTKKDFTQSKEYKEMIERLGKVIKEAHEKGVDFFVRDDVLRCRCCGAYEDVTMDEGWGVYVNRICVKKERFIVINRSVRYREKKGIQTHWIHYQFICSVCGAFQKETVKYEYLE